MPERMPPRLWICLALLLTAPAARAAIYKSIDAQGNVIYSNQPTPGARRLDLGPVLRQRDTPVTVAAPPHTSPAGFPRISPQEQQQRDQTRRQILESELAREEQALDQARQALQQGEAVRLGSERNYQKYLDRVKGLKDAVTAHEKNVAAIRKELSGLR